MEKQRGMLWLRSDLRLVDHEALLIGAERCKELTPVFFFDPAWCLETRWGFPRMSARRVAFLLRSLRSLREALRARGSDLWVMRGSARQMLPELLSELDCDALYFHREAAFDEVEEESDVLNACRSLGVEAIGVWGHTLHHLDDLPFPLEKLPKSFTPFRHKVERKSQVREALAEPSTLPPVARVAEPSSGLPDTLTLEALGVSAPDVDAADYDPRDLNRFEAGRLAAKARLDHYLWEGDCLRRYKETRNGMLQPDDSSKLSPWLAVGTISPREAHAEVERYEALRCANESTYWLKFELRWRDYFRFVALHAGARLFSPRGPAGKKKPSRFRSRDFDSWRLGETGCAIVDASMRELSATGYLSNRARQLAASFFVNELGLDWRAGAAWFESQLLDYDPCSNYGNWAYIAGVGNDPRGGRHFNLEDQAQRYDPDGAFRGHWLK